MAVGRSGVETEAEEQAFGSLACILYEMCCLNHAFAGSNFLSVVLKIVEGSTPSLPSTYPRELNAIMESMLNKSPSLRPSAIEILKLPYIDAQLQHLMCRYSEITLEDKNLNCQKEAAYIINAVQRKLHLQTLRALSEVQKMSPRERMRLRKVQVADEEAGKLKCLGRKRDKVGESTQTDCTGPGRKSWGRLGTWADSEHADSEQLCRALAGKDDQSSDRDPAGQTWEFDAPAAEDLPASQPVPSPDLGARESSVEDTIADLGDHEIPEDPLVAEEYYADAFDSCSEESEEEEENTVFSAGEEEVKDEEPQPAYRTNQQDSDTEALVRCLEHILGHSSLGGRDFGKIVPVSSDARNVYCCSSSSLVTCQPIEDEDSVTEELRRRRATASARARAAAAGLRPATCYRDLTEEVFVVPQVFPLVNKRPLFLDECPLGSGPSVVPAEATLPHSLEPHQALDVGASGQLVVRHPDFYTSARLPKMRNLLTGDIRSSPITFQHCSTYFGITFQSQFTPNAKKYGPKPQ
ncbi:NIMA (never in mitosis gene a)- related kinase 11 [Camelus ferus]|nr:NIMA (never in mitosis gene a)- related kinase 11 [Camelus ferus]